jgi:hypothetical protein
MHGGQIGRDVLGAIDAAGTQDAHLLEVIIREEKRFKRKLLSH